MRAALALLLLMPLGCSFAITEHGFVSVAGSGYVQTGPACPIDTRVGVEVVELEDGEAVTSDVLGDDPAAQPGSCTEVVSNGFSIPFVSGPLNALFDAVRAAVGIVAGMFGQSVGG